MLGVNELIGGCIVLGLFLSYLGFLAWLDYKGKKKGVSV